MAETDIRKILFPVFVTTGMVVNEAVHVSIASRDIIRRCAKQLINRWDEFWQRIRNPYDSSGDPYFLFGRIGDSDEEILRWLFVIDTLNYSFWPNPGSPLWSVEYAGREWSGYWGLAASFKRAYEEGIPLTDALFLSELREDTLKHVFRGKGEIPLFRSRLAHLKGVGQILLKYFEGDVTNVVRASEKSAEKLVKFIVTYFPFFRDEASYKGRRVFFWKRAQIYAFDIFLAFNGKGWGEFYDIDVLTAFADYKLPQVLRALGVLRYSEDLSGLIDNRIPIMAGSPEEVEIRAATVQSVELLRQELEGLTGIHDILAARVDQFLWYLGQEESFRVKPYHLCRTVFY